MATDTASSRVLADIRAEMARKTVDQKTLAGWLGVSRPWLSRRLSGQTRLSLDEIEMIADALGFAVDLTLRPQLAAEGER